MVKVYFTYGSDDSQPFKGGWTIVEAPTEDMAIQAFRCVHPDKNSYINCSFIYSEEKFNNTMMSKEGNFGYHCRETITLSVE